MTIHISIDTVSTRPIYVQIIDEVRRALVIGTLKAEDPLPSIRQLATELRVNPNTVQQAYRELDSEGLIYVRRGQGTFISAGILHDSERVKLSKEVAERALHDAYRHGLAVEDFIHAFREISAQDIPTDKLNRRVTLNDASHSH